MKKWMISLIALTMSVLMIAIFLIVAIAGITGNSSEDDCSPSSETSNLTGQSSEDWNLILVNRENTKEEMSPSTSTVEGITVDSRIVTQTTEFLAAAKAIDPAFHLISGYRSVETQKGLYEGYIADEMSQRGINREEAIPYVHEYSQPPGASEHMTGLAIDISTVDELNRMDANVASKLEELAPQYGFVKRFKAEKKSHTGVGDEDWHYRYVGTEAAKEMSEGNLSLEEYVTQLKSQSTSQSNQGQSGNQEAVPSSIEDFVKEHKEAYILSWKAGGFLPSASIAQTMVENGFNFTNPSGTSLWMAHNMGGVKTSRLTDFPVTLATFGDDSVDLTGTKPGTNVGDNTGGAYAWFKSYDAGIVGKAEFMAHQSLYTSAINNTDPKGTLTAIYAGGWATDPNYLTSLLAAYENVGKQFAWLDQEAIKKHGNAPYEKVAGPTTPSANTASNISFNDSVSAEDCDDHEGGNSSTSGSVSGAHSAPTIAMPAEYKGKLPFGDPDNNNYAGNNYPFGQCTWGVYNRMAQVGKPLPWFAGNDGNAANWAAAAQRQGYKVTKGKAKVGEAACFPPGVGASDPTYGHIAFVEYVNDDGSILISETNAGVGGIGTRSWRVLSKELVSQLQFIEGKK